ncbi:MAG TPA: XdhC family protein [Polyangiaceae bacterium]|nr:XdhC family protein [Polyangiaceae bacterium]
MNETEMICRAAALVKERGEASWLASVVRVRGSAYRRAGARLLFTREAAVAGSISAGCIENALVQSGSFFAADRPVLRTFEAALPDDDEPQPGSGCGGSVDVLIEPVVEGCADTLAFIGEALAGQQRVAMVTVVHSSSRFGGLGARVVRSGNQSLSVGCELALESELELFARESLETGPAKARCIRRGALELLLEVLEPSPRLFVFGAGPDVPPLVSLASQLGWDVTVVSRRDRPALRERFVGLPCRYVVSDAAALVPAINRSTRALAVVMSHDFANDSDCLEALLQANPHYLGVLGPLARTQRLLSEIENRGGDVLGGLSRLHAPVGLNIGAETSAEIALAIVAEAQARLKGADAQTLREKSGPVHAPPLPDLRLALAEAAE